MHVVCCAPQVLTAVTVFDRLRSARLYNGCVQPVLPVLMTLRTSPPAL